MELMENKTLTQYDTVTSKCRSIFISKTADYGTSWRVFRLPSITDQIYIKAQRIRTIEVKGVSKINEGREEEFIGIINYCIMALIQIEMENDPREEIPVEEIETIYDAKLKETRDLMIDKNHDYGEAWRQMRIPSFSDMLLVRLKRIKQIEGNDGKTISSEGVYSNYQDMINYSIFALIKISEEHE